MVYEIENILPGESMLPSVRRRERSELFDVRTGNESGIATTCQDHDLHGIVTDSGLEGHHQLRHRQPIERIAKDTQRDFFFSGDEALDYGIIDAVMYDRKSSNPGD